MTKKCVFISFGKVKIIKDNAVILKLGGGGVINKKIISLDCIAYFDRNYVTIWRCSILPKTNVEIFVLNSYTFQQCTHTFLLVIKITQTQNIQRGFSENGKTFKSE